MQVYTLKIIQIKKETADTVTICFKQPALKKIKYQAGQYLTLIFRINGRRYIRPYSFSSSPEIDPLLEITVKRVSNGIVSNHINDTVKEGEIIEVMHPMGDFIVPENKEFNTVFLWGVGSGITPLFSIIKFLLSKRPEVSVHLIYGNRSDETTIFDNIIKEKQKDYSTRFNVFHFHTRLTVNQKAPNIIQGRINPEKVISILSKEKCVEALHFICGPTGLKDSVIEVLTLLNTPSENIYTEDFELLKNPKDFEAIETQNIKINFQGKEFKLEVIKGKSVLEVALDANIELPYSCQTGNCSTCKGVLKEGNLKMIGLSKERDDLRDNEYLLCCSYPLDNKVSIEI